MIYVRVNKGAESTNMFKLTKAATNSSTKLQLKKHVFANAANLADMVYTLPDGTEKTKTWGTPPNTWSDVRNAIEAELIAEGFVISDASAIKVVTDGTGFDITIIGNIDIASISSVTAVVSNYN